MSLSPESCPARPADDTSTADDAAKAGTPRTSVSHIVADLSGSYSFAELNQKLDALRERYGDHLHVRPTGARMVIVTDADLYPLECGCGSCEDIVRTDLAALAAEAGENPFLTTMMRSFMIVCPQCGNKRCPRAAHHDNACTRSNEPGQPGSSYPALPAGY